METLMAELIAVSPIAAAMIIMTVLFLRYMRSRDKEWSETVKHINSKQVKVHDTCMETVKENTLVMGKVEKLLELRIKQIGG